MHAKFLPGESPRTQVMTIFGSYGGSHFPNTGYFEVYGGICRYMKVYKGIWRYLKVFKGI